MSLIDNVKEAFKTCNELEEVNQKISCENLKLMNSVIELFEALKYMHEQHKCNCGHPVCNRCEDDKCNEALLKTHRLTTGKGKHE